MGNLCLKDYNHKYNDKVTCYKCYDKFYTDRGGIYSQRKSCRFHDFNEKGVCNNCHLTNINSASGCFHVKRQRWYSFLTG